MLNVVDTAIYAALLHCKGVRAYSDVHELAECWCLIILFLAVISNLEFRNQGHTNMVIAASFFAAVRRGFGGRSGWTLGLCTYFLAATTPFSCTPHYCFTHTSAHIYSYREKK